MARFINEMQYSNSKISLPLENIGNNLKVLAGNGSLT